MQNKYYFFLTHANKLDIGNTRIIHLHDIHLLESDH